MKQATARAAANWRRVYAMPAASVYSPPAFGSQVLDGGSDADGKLTDKRRANVEGDILQPGFLIAT
jgi:hypothetical protein